MIAPIKAKIACATCGRFVAFDDEAHDLILVPVPDEDVATLSVTCRAKKLNVIWHTLQRWWYQYGG